MGLIITNDSHTDHGLSQDALDFIVARYADRDGFFIDTFELPEQFGEIECGLHGPVVGDAPVPDSECTNESRNGRPYTSRLCDRAARPTRTLTVIAGPHGDDACVLYTAFGGPLAPKEPGDETLTDEQRAESEAFWSEHALTR